MFACAEVDEQFAERGHVHRFDQMSVKALLRRVSKLEPKPSKILLKIGGSIEKFDAQVQAGIEEGRYDRADMPIVARAIRKWASM